MFDLNAAVADWRRRLARRDDLGADDLDELEDHLRESVADLCGRGLAEEEAFLVAARRLGDTDALGPSPSVADPERRRRLRLRWLALGAVLAVAMLAFGALTARMTGLGPDLLFGGEPFFTSTRMLTLMIQLLFLGVGGLLVWRLLTGDRAARRVQEGGLAWAVRLLVTVVCGGVIVFFLLALVFRVGAVLGGPGFAFAAVPMHAIWAVPVLTMLLVPALLLLLVWWLTGTGRR